MIHPYCFLKGSKDFDKIPEIEATLDICTLYQGVPYGPAIITFNHKRKKWLSFEGVGIFTNGKLDGGPFTYIDDFGRSR
jgi:hypothetical protein